MIIIIIIIIIDNDNNDDDDDKMQAKTKDVKEKKRTLRMVNIDLHAKD